LGQSEKSRPVLDMSAFAPIAEGRKDVHGLESHAATRIGRARASLAVGAR